MSHRPNYESRSASSPPRESVYTGYSNEKRENPGMNISHKSKKDSGSSAWEKESKGEYVNMNKNWPPLPPAESMYSPWEPPPPIEKQTPKERYISQYEHPEGVKLHPNLPQTPQSMLPPTPGEGILAPGDSGEYDVGIKPRDWDARIRKSLDMGYPSMHLYPPICFCLHPFFSPSVTLDRRQIGVPILSLNPYLLSKEERRVELCLRLCMTEAFASVIFYFMLSKKRLLKYQGLPTYKLLHGIRQANLAMIPISYLGAVTLISKYDRMQAYKFRYWSVDQINSYRTLLMQLKQERKLTRPKIL